MAFLYTQIYAQSFLKYSVNITIKQNYPYQNKILQIKHENITCELRSYLPTSIGQNYIFILLNKLWKCQTNQKSVPTYRMHLMCTFAFVPFYYLSLNCCPLFNHVWPRLKESVSRVTLNLAVTSHCLLFDLIQCHPNRPPAAPHSIPPHPT